MPTVISSLIYTGVRPCARCPLTYVPYLEPVSLTNQPACRRSNTQWSRETAMSSSVMSQLRPRPMEFSHESTGRQSSVCLLTSMISGFSSRLCRRMEE